LPDDLAEIIINWPLLSEHIKQTIMTLIGTSTTEHQQ
jgi:hypothetical protein